MLSNLIFQMYCEPWCVFLVYKKMTSSLENVFLKSFLNSQQKVHFQVILEVKLES